MPDAWITRLEGLDETTRGFSILLASLSDLRPFWPRVVPLFIRWMREQFESEGEWGGERWAPLSPDYLARKMAKYPGKGILYATGDLRRAASTPERRPFPLALELIIDDSTMKHGATTPRAVGLYHQFGGGSSEIGGIEGRPPRRPIIPDVLPAEAQIEIAAAADEYVADLCRRLNLPV